MTQTDSHTPPNHSPPLNPPPRMLVYGRSRFHPNHPTPNPNPKPNPDLPPPRPSFLTFAEYYINEDVLVSDHRPICGIYNLKVNLNAPDVLFYSGQVEICFFVICFFVF
jgi:hypothetical protein